MEMTRSEKQDEADFLTVNMPAKFPLTPALLPLN